MTDDDIMRLFNERSWEARIRTSYAQKKLKVLLAGIAFLTAALWIAAELVKR